MSAPLLLLAATLGLADQPSVRLTEGEPQAVEIVGLPAEQLARWQKQPPKAADWPEIFSVTIVSSDADAPPMLGSYEVHKTGVKFHPRFPLSAGQQYVVRFNLDGVTSLNEKLTIPKADYGPPTVVERIYPSATRLPENTLRLYIAFSKPMTRGDAYRNIRLLDGNGREIEDQPFLELEQELWDGEGKRFTLLFDPGRVKRGLAPREIFGPSLEAGKRYTLRISEHWPDENGQPLGKAFEKRFSVGPPDELPIDPRSWSLSPPKAGTDQAVAVRLPKPVDYALLGRLVVVTDVEGRPIAGRTSVGGGERVYTFTPDRPWRAGEYRLRIGMQLEDPCGNRVDKPFEVDIFGPVTKKIEQDYFWKPFKVR